MNKIMRDYGGVYAIPSSFLIGKQGDITSKALISTNSHSTAIIKLKENGVLCGINFAIETFKTIDKKMVNTIKEAMNEGDSVGGAFQVHVSGVPYGLGGYTSWHEKLNARLGQAILSINGIKSFSIGLGEESDNKRGSELHDEIGFQKNKFTRMSNNCGGIEGGMSNAQPIIISATMKPIPTLSTFLNYKIF